MLENENITGEVLQAQTPDAGETKDRVSFDELITGDYRDEYKERVESIVKNRLKSHAEDKRRFTELTESLTALAECRGIETRDPIEIIAKLEKQGNITVEASEAFSQEEKEACTSGLTAPVVDRVRALAGKVEAARELYPDLDIVSELRDPMFVRLMTAADGDVRRAYEMKYHDRIITNAMKYASEAAEERLAEAMASRKNRPAENAVAGGSAAMMTSDPKNLTRAQRSEIKKRVRRGEKILW